MVFKQDKELSFSAKATLVSYRALYMFLLSPVIALYPFLKHFSRRLQEGLIDYLGLLPPTDPNNKVFWVHGVSMGESSVAFALIEELKKLFPEASFVFTTTHPDVLKTANNKNKADICTYFPLDAHFSMTKAFNRIKPDAVFISETDFWPEFSWQCKKRKLPLFLINGRIGDKICCFYSMQKSLGELIFTSFANFFVQTPGDKKKLVKIGVDPQLVEVTGNIKADLLPSFLKADIENVKKAFKDRSVVVFGSLHPSEFEELFPSMLKAVRNGNRLLIAPRNIKNADLWQKRFSEASVNCILKTELRNRLLPEAIILNTMGELSSLYSLATVAFIGGTLDKSVGGHNPLEIINAHVPLISGNYFRNFADVTEELQEKKAVKIVKDAESFESALSEFLQSPDLALSYSKAAFEVLQNNSGALKRTTNLIVSYFAS